MARKFPYEIKGGSALVAKRPLMADYDQNLFESACDFLEITPNDKARLIALAEEALTMYEKDDTQILHLVAHVMGKHPIERLTSIDLINAIAHAHDIVMASRATY